MVYVYVLVSVEKEFRLYIGMSEEVERRLAEHNRGKVQSTKAFRPWRLVVKEKFFSRKAAREREKELKQGSSRERLKLRWGIGQ